MFIELKDGDKVVPIEATDCIVFTSFDIRSGKIAPIGDYESLPKNNCPVIITKKETGLEILLVWTYATTILYRDPATQEAAVFELNVIPPHDHRDISHGGPAIGIYNVFKE
jgi:hypothetical protein